MQEAKIGILGLGSRATLYYIRQLNERYQARMGGFHTFPFLMQNANFHRINPYLPHNMKEIEMVFRDYLNNLMAMGPRHLLVPNITLHELLDDIGLPVSVRLVHPTREAEAILRTLPGRPLMIWGSTYTMRKGYLPQHFEKLGELVVRPDKADEQRIEQLRKKVYKDGIQEESQAEFNELLDKYKADARILLACTELSLLDKPFGAPDLLDMVELQIQKAISIHLGEQAE